MVTVKQLIDSLMKYNPDSPVEIAVNQYNKRYPVAYCDPKESVMLKDLYANMKNGKHVRIEICLPSDGDKYMGTMTRKK